MDTSFFQGMQEKDPTNKNQHYKYISMIFVLNNNPTMIQHRVQDSRYDNSLVYKYHAVL